jgi:hypothetical protein
LRAAPAPTVISDRDRLWARAIRGLSRPWKFESSGASEKACYTAVSGVGAAVVGDLA